MQVPNSKFSMKGFSLRRGESRSGGRQWLANREAQVGVNFQLAIDFQVPGWRDFYRCVCLLRGRERLGFLLGRKENSLAPYRVLVRGPICFPSSLVFIVGSEVGLPAETGLPSPVEPSPPVTPSLSPPHPFSLWPQTKLGQGPALTYSGAGMDPPNKDLFIQPLESGHGGTGNNWNII